MHSSTSTALFFLASAGLSLAQTTTQTLYIPGADQQPLEASILASDASATTYLVQCIPGTDADDCGLGSAITLTEGPRTAAYTIGPESDNGTLLYTGYMACSLDTSSISAVCVESADGSEANFPGISTVTYTGTDLAYMPVVVTAKAGATGGSVAASTTTAAVKSSTISGTVGKTSATGTTNSSGGLVAQTTMPTTSGSLSTSSSTGAGPAVTGNAGWVVGGFAAALALMA